MRILAAGSFLIAALHFAAAVPARAQETRVFTDTSWKGSDPTAEPANWNRLDYDDSRWPSARDDSALNGFAEYGVANVFGVPARARWIWGGPETGCYLSKRFAVPAGFRRAELVAIADNAAVIFLNAERILETDTDAIDWGCRGCAEILDVTGALREGENLIAVSATNWGGPAGFALELRIDGEPFVPPLPEGTALVPEDSERLAALVRELDAPDYARRERATSDLADLARRLGWPAARAIENLLEEANLEVRSRIERAIAEAVPPLDPPEGRDARFAFGRLDGTALLALLTGPPNRHVPCVRHVVSAGALAFDHPEAVDRALADARESGSDVARTRADRLARWLGR